MNLNKLFPRLSIRAKLAVAFAGLAMVPLALLALVTTEVTLAHLHSVARQTTAHDLETARAETEAVLAELERDVAYLADGVLSEALDAKTPAGRASAERLGRAFLTRTPALFQVKLIDDDGVLVDVLRAVGRTPPAPDEREVGGAYYRFRAASLEAGEHLLIPVELRGQPGSTPIPAMAVLVPIRDGRGVVRGAVVGEAYASAVFAGLEAGTPGLTGVTGLVDPDGHFLYHSVRKRDWASLLATRSQLDLASDFSGSESQSILSGRVGMLLASRSRLVAFAPLRLGTPAIRPLILYRAVPLATLEAPIREFLRWVAIVGLVLVAAVLGLAALAANQFTRPIYQLRAGVARLARGASQEPLQIATNDEFEDLAADFSAMAASLSEYRRRLEEALTERTRALQQTHAELTDILAHSADAIIGLDRDGRVRIWNRGAERLFGYGAGEAIGSDVDTLLAPAPSERTAEAAFIRRELEKHGAVVNLPTRRRAKDGRFVPVTLTQTPLCDAGGVACGASLILRDASKQAILDEQMRRSERLAAVSVMAAGLAHELNNPLAVIANRVECIEREVRQRCPHCFFEPDLAVLRQHTGRLTGVAQDLLRFTREGDDTAALLDVGVLAGRIVHLLERTFVGRNVRVEVAVADDLPPVLGSERALETVCMNLLLNAAEAMPAGGAVRVEIRPAAGDEAVELTVSDTGPGISPELQERVFEPFFTTKRGTGLGLAVCRSVVERHRGRIHVENAAGAGARFVVTLPSAGLERA